MREKSIEQELVRAVRTAGGLCAKWVSPGLDGVPDRIVLMPGGRLAFVEVKAPGKSPGYCSLEERNNWKHSVSGYT